MSETLVFVAGLCLGLYLRSLADWLVEGAPVVDEDEELASMAEWDAHRRGA